jgi:uncharacterized protein (TIGR02421 family)
VEAAGSGADLAVVETSALRNAFGRGVPLDAAGDGIRLLVDGARPFLVLVRDAEPDDPIARLVRGEAAYLRAGPDADPVAVAETIRRVARAGVEEHGTFLLIEIWGGDRYRILGPDGPAPATVRSLADGLEALSAGPSPVEVDVVGTPHRSPPGLDPVLDVTALHELGALLVGVEMAETWRDPETGALYPVHLRRLAHDLSGILRRAAFEFLRVQTGTTLSSYRALGRRSLGDAVWEADRRLAEIDGSFDTLLLVAPVNGRAAWERFRDGGYQRDPELHYRLLPVEPDLLKRELYEIRLEEVEDPAAWKLLRDKREELDKQISLLGDRNSPEFLHSAIRLFGTVSPSLKDRAEEILREVPPPGGRRSRERVGAEAFAARAQAEFDHYRSVYPEFRSEIQIRPDLVGLMVSSGRLLVGRDLALTPDRVEALLQHEVGTHVLTYVNGAAQPFLQLAHGFADYDEMQEGLGVLAEYLVGGLTPARIRLLAARVVAVDCRIAGAEFVETFRRLHDDHGFTARTSFGITNRVYQGGGFTRDHIYLRGFVQVVEYLRDGGALEPLYVGKIAPRHLEVVQELQERGVLRPVPLLPRFLERESSLERLRALRDGLPLHAMVSIAESNG